MYVYDSPYRLRKYQLAKNTLKERFSNGKLLRLLQKIQVISNNKITVLLPRLQSYINRPISIAERQKRKGLYRYFLFHIYLLNLGSPSFISLSLFTRICSIAEDKNN